MSAKKRRPRKTSPLSRYVVHHPGNVSRIKSYVTNSNTRLFHVHDDVTRSNQTRRRSASSPTNISKSESIAMPQNQKREAFSAPPGYDELFGLDLSHLNPEERAAILQVAARAKQIEQLETRKVKNIKNQVDAFVQSEQTTKPEKPLTTKPTASTNVKKEERSKQNRPVPVERKRVAPIVKVNTDGNNNVCLSRIGYVPAQWQSVKLMYITYTDKTTPTTVKVVVPTSHEDVSLEKCCELCLVSDRSKKQKSNTNCTSCDRKICNKCHVSSSILAKKGEILCKFCDKQRELAARSNVWMKNHPARKNINRSVSVDIPIQRSKDSSTSIDKQKKNSSWRRRSFSEISSLLRNGSFELPTKPEQRSRTPDPPLHKARISEISISEMLVRRLSTDKLVQDELRKKMEEEDNEKSARIKLKQQKVMSFPQCNKQRLNNEQHDSKKQQSYKTSKIKSTTALQSARSQPITELKSIDVKSQPITAPDPTNSRNQPITSLQSSIARSEPITSPRSTNVKSQPIRAPQTNAKKQPMTGLQHCMNQQNTSNLSLTSNVQPITSQPAPRSENQPITNNLSSVTVNNEVVNQSTSQLLETSGKTSKTSNSLNMNTDHKNKVNRVHKDLRSEPNMLKEKAEPSVLNNHVNGGPYKITSGKNNMQYIEECSKPTSNDTTNVPTVLSTKQSTKMKLQTPDEVTKLSEQACGNNESLLYNNGKTLEKYASYNDQTKEDTEVTEGLPNKQSNATKCILPIYAEGWIGNSYSKQDEESVMHHGTSSVGSSIADSDGPAEWSVDELDDNDTLFLVTSSNNGFRSGISSPYILRPEAQTSFSNQFYNKCDYDMMENDTEGDFDHLLQEMEERDAFTSGGLKRVAPFSDLSSVARPSSLSSSEYEDNQASTTNNQGLSNSNLCKNNSNQGEADSNSSTNPTTVCSKDTPNMETTENVYKEDWENKDLNGENKSSSSTTKFKTSSQKLDNVSSVINTMSEQSHLFVNMKPSLTRSLSDNQSNKSTSSIPKITISNSNETKEESEKPLKFSEDISSEFKVSTQKNDPPSNSVKHISMQIEQNLQKSKGTYHNKFTSKNLNTSSRLPVSPLVTSENNFGSSNKLLNENDESKMSVPNSNKVYAVHGKKYFDSDSEDSGSDMEDEMLESATSSVPIYPEEMEEPGSSNSPPGSGSSIKKSIFFRRTTSTDNFEELLMKTTETPRPRRNKPGNSTKTKSASSLLSTPDTIYKSSTWVRSVSLSPPSQHEDGDNDGKLNNIRRNSEPSFTSTVNNDVATNIVSNDLKISKANCPLQEKQTVVSLPPHVSSSANSFCGLSINNAYSPLPRCVSCGTVSTLGRNDDTHVTKIVPQNELNVPTERSTVKKVHSVSSSTQVSPDREVASIFPSIDLCQLTALIEALKGARDLVNPQEPVTDIKSFPSSNYSAPVSKQNHQSQFLKGHPVTKEPRSSSVIPLLVHKDKSTSTNISGQPQIHPEDTILFPRVYSSHITDPYTTHTMPGKVDASVGTDSSIHHEKRYTNVYNDPQPPMERYQPQRCAHHSNYSQESRDFIPRPMYMRREYNYEQDYYCPDNNPRRRCYEYGRSQSENNYNTMYTESGLNQWPRNYSYDHPTKYNEYIHDDFDDSIIYEEGPGDFQLSSNRYGHVRNRDQFIMKHRPIIRGVNRYTNRTEENRYKTDGNSFEEQINDSNPLRRSSSVPTVTKPNIPPCYNAGSRRDMQMEPNYGESNIVGVYENTRHNVSEQSFQRGHHHVDMMRNNPHLPSDSRHMIQATSSAKSFPSPSQTSPLRSMPHTHIVGSGKPHNDVKDDQKFSFSRSVSTSSRMSEELSGFDHDISQSRRHLPDPPDEDEYRWRYNSVKRHNILTSNRTRSVGKDRTEEGPVRGTHRLKQTIEDLDQQEKELDMKLRYLELGRQSKSNSSLVNASVHGTDRQHSRHVPMVENRNNDSTPVDDIRDNSTAVMGSTSTDNSRNYVIVDDIMQIIPQDGGSTKQTKSSHQNNLQQHHVTARDQSNEKVKRNYSQHEVGYATRGRHVENGFDDFFAFQSPVIHQQSGHYTHDRNQVGTKRVSERNYSDYESKTSERQRMRDPRDHQENQDHNDQVYHVRYAHVDDGESAKPWINMRKGKNLRYDVGTTRDAYTRDMYMVGCANEEQNSYKVSKDSLGRVDDSNRGSNVYIKTVPSRKARETYRALTAAEQYDLIQDSRSSCNMNPEELREQTIDRSPYGEPDDMRTVVSDTEAYYLEREMNDWFEKPDNDLNERSKATNYADFSNGFDLGRE
ncbi:uncharacterized protein LOC104265744 [Ciona intestinalis]